MQTKKVKKCNLMKFPLVFFAPPNFRLPRIKMQKRGVNLNSGKNVNTFICF